MKSLSAVLLILLVLGSQDQFVKVPLNDPLNSFTGPPIEVTKISGKLLGTIADGDFVHPTFSPDANTLAYARVLTPANTENTEVLLRRVSDGQKTVLFSSSKAWKYATYKAFVQDMSWKIPTRLEVEIHDGDVDATRLVFNPSSRRLIREEQMPSIDDQPLPLPIPEPLQAARTRARSLFPTLSAEKLDDALRYSAFPVGDKGIILLGNFEGDNSNIWFLDFADRSMKLLINLPAQQHISLGGGITFGPSTIILLFDASAAYLFQYKEGRIRPLTKIATSGHASLEVKYQSTERVVFQIMARAPYERGDNPLFVFDGSLRRINEYQELHDVDFDRAGRRVAFCYWNGNKRNISIKELN